MVKRMCHFQSLHSMIKVDTADLDLCTLTDSVNIIPWIIFITFDLLILVYMADILASTSQRPFLKISFILFFQFFSLKMKITFLPLIA